MQEPVLPVRHVLLQLLMVVALAASVVAIPGCASQQTARQDDEMTPAADTGETEQAPADTARPEAAAPQIPDALALTGTWVHDPRPVGPTSPGIRFSITVDSTTSDYLFGHLSYYMAGDMAADPASFRPFRADAPRDSILHIAIEVANAGRPGFVLDGIVRGDTIQMTGLILGPDTVAVTEDHWLLVRRSR